MESKRTKGEWIYTIWDNDTFGSMIEISSPSEIIKVTEIPYLEEPAKANAEYICKAVNNYDDLVEALDICYRSLMTYGRHPLIDKPISELLKKLKP